jgi:transposase
MGKGPSTRRYSDEFKRDAVALYRRSGRPIKDVARELGISDTSLGTWVRESKGDAPAEEVESAKEEARLRKRIRELEEEIEILKRFTRYWVKEEGK